MLLLPHAPATRVPTSISPSSLLPTNPTTSARCKLRTTPVNWATRRYDTAPGSVVAAVLTTDAQRQKTQHVLAFVTLTDIGDGTSNTLCCRETLMAKSHDDNDWRGDIRTTTACSSSMTLTPLPNTPPPARRSSTGHPPTTTPYRRSSTPQGFAVQQRRPARTSTG